MLGYITNKLKNLPGTSSATKAAHSVLPNQINPPTEHPEQTLQDMSYDGVRILLLGRSGSGKTLFAQTARSGRQPKGEPLIKPTMKATSRSFNFAKKDFKLIETPGFDNTGLSNLDAFRMLADYLLHRDRVQIGFSGIIYIHRAGDALRSRALTQNMGVISDIFLGDSGLSRLVIMIVPPTSGTYENVPIENISLDPLFHAAKSKGARIVESTFDVGDVDDILLSCIPQKPLLLRIQQEFIRSPSIDVPSQIQQRLGYFEAKSVEEYLDKEINERLAQSTDRIKTLEEEILDKNAKITELSNARIQSDHALADVQRDNIELGKNYASLLKVHQEHVIELESFKASLEDARSKLAEYAQSYTHIKQQLANSREESTGLRQHLQQVQSEYASLRSNLQIQENTEQTDIVRALNDLNRNIDDLGRLMSEYLVDNFTRKAFKEIPGKLTALNAHHLTELKALLGHIDGLPSLVVPSLENTGMPAEDFLDYAIRTLLCKHLCRRIFSPFHPAVHSSVNDTMVAMYDRIQQQEPQAVAAKWRANSFKSIHNGNAETITQQVELVAHEFINQSLTQLLLSFFGKEAGIMLQESHRDSLIQLYRTAWDWNATLKGEVIVLGDFYPTYYPPRHRFNPDLMAPFETSSAPSEEETILGTLGLGLLVSRATGGGKPPQMTVVLKATVGTVGLYT